MDRAVLEDRLWRNHAKLAGLLDKTRDAQEQRRRRLGGDDRPWPKGLNEGLKPETTGPQAV